MSKMRNGIVVLILILQFVFINPQYWYEYFNDGLGNVRYGFQARRGKLHTESLKNYILLQKLLDITENNTNGTESQYVSEFEKNDTFINITESTTIRPSSNHSSVDPTSPDVVVQKSKNITSVDNFINNDSRGGANPSTPKLPCNVTKTLEEKKNCSAGDLKLEFPNRIGTNAIITLQGPPG